VPPPQPTRNAVPLHLSPSAPTPFPLRSRAQQWCLPFDVIPRPTNSTHRLAICPPILHMAMALSPNLLLALNPTTSPTAPRQDQLGAPPGGWGSPGQCSPQKQASQAPCKLYVIVLVNKSALLCKKKQQQQHLIRCFTAATPPPDYLKVFCKTKSTPQP